MAQPKTPAPTMTTSDSWWSVRRAEADPLGERVVVDVLAMVASVVVRPRGYVYAVLDFCEAM